MNLWMKALLGICVATGLYKALAPKPPPEPDSGMTQSETRAALAAVFEGGQRICFNVPRLPQGRFIEPGRRVVPRQPGGRRPYLEDFVEAGVLVHSTDERITTEADSARVETYRVALPHRQDYQHVQGGGQLCFATATFDTLLSVQRAAPGSKDHLIRFRLKVAGVSDWVRRLPEEARGDAQAWFTAASRDTRAVYCKDDKKSTDRMRPGHGVTCAGAYVDDDPPRAIPTGPQPLDDGRRWEHWTVPTYDGASLPR